jgi:twitching motility two-component system response regulator PilG
MASPTLVDLLQVGIAAARAGDRQAARGHLLEAIRLRPDYEVPWLWLSWITANRAQAAWFLGRVLAISPDHRQARDWMLRLQKTLGKPDPWHCPFCGLGARQAEVRCPGCQALFAASRIDAWCALPMADRPLLRACVAFLECPAGRSEQPSWHWMLGIAHLNLGNFTSAFPYLRQACARSSGNGTLVRLTGELEAWLAEQGAGSPAVPRGSNGAGSAPARGAPGARPPTAPERQGIGAPARNLVLVVDDSPTVRKLVGVTLESCGYRAVMAADGMQALARLDESVPDLVLLDIAMPKLDGYRVCRMIKSNQRTRLVPVVMLSGKDGLFDRLRGRAAGADDYMTKPVDRQTLLRALERWAPRGMPN